MTYKSRMLLVLLLAFVVSCSPAIPSDLKGRIVFASNKDVHTNIYTSDLDGQNLKRLTNNYDALEYQPKWSPDGKKIVFVSVSGDAFRGGLYMMNADGSDQTRLNTIPYSNINSPEWSPDGKKIVFTADSNLVMLDLATGRLSKLTSNIETSSLSWSPDGKKLVFDHLLQTLQSQRLSTINEDGTNQTDLTLSALTPHADLKIIGAPSWSPDGKTIAFGNLIWIKSNPLDFGPFRDIAINTGVQSKLDEIFTNLTIHSYTLIMQPNGSGVSQITDRCRGGQWSPDSKWLICTSKSNGNNGSSEIYIVNISSGDSFRLTDTPYNEFDPDWAP